MRLAVITAVWRRYALTALYWRWAGHLGRWWAPHQVVPIAAVSEDRDEALAQAAGAVTVRVPNHPLGAKFNAALGMARQCEADAVLVMGSDDFLCAGTAGALLASFEAGATYVGLEDLYFLHLQQGWLRYFRGYRPPRRGEPVGCGRLYDRTLLERCGWQLWDAHVHQGMDHSSMRRAAAIAAPRLLNVRALGGCAVDCKSGENLNAWAGAYGPQIATDEVLGRLPPDLVAGLEALRTPETRRTLMAPETMRIRFVKNVSYHGENYGPDYDEDVVDANVGDARQFLYQGRAVPAETKARRLGRGGDAGDIAEAEIRDPDVRTADPSLTAAGAGRKPKKKSSKGSRKKTS